MRKKLTALSLGVAPPKSGRIEIRDSESPLTLRITKDGGRSFCVRTYLNGAAVRVGYPRTVVGSPPGVAGEILADARRWAREMVDKARLGEDPRETPERRAAKEAAANRAAERAAQRTFGKVASAYLSRRVRGEKGNRSADEIERILNAYFVPRWRDVQIGDITRAEVNEVLDDIFDGKAENKDPNSRRFGHQMGGPVMADRALAQLRALFNWWATRDDGFTSPIVAGMARTPASQQKRDRVLNNAEIAALWASTKEDTTFNGIVRALLLTAQRRDEVAQMARIEIVDGLWTIPAERYKTGKPNNVPLTKQVLAIVADQDVIDNCDLVFTTNGKTPFSGFGKAKRQLDAAMLRELHKTNPNATLPDWRLHDLRRTAKTLMAKSGVRPDISERVLGHVIQGVEGVYDQHDYVAEKRMALEKLAAAIERIVVPAGDNVVELRAAE